MSKKQEASHSPITFASKPQFVSEPKKDLEQPLATTFASYSGPIPPPNFLVQYEQMVPGIAKRFLDEPHIEAEHRRSLEKTMALEQVKIAKRGQIMAFSLATFCAVGGFGAIFLGYRLEGLGALVASIATFAYVFCYAKKR